MEATRADVVAEARSWIGVPWRHQGRTRAGVDCVGLVVVVCTALGMTEYDTAAYGREPDPQRFLGHFSAGGGIRINPMAAMDGDLLVFQQSGFPCHVGIRSTRHGAFHAIHAHMRHRKVIEERVATMTPLMSAFRLPGLVA